MFPGPEVCSVFFERSDEGRFCRRVYEKGLTKEDWTFRRDNNRGYNGRNGLSSNDAFFHRLFAEATKRAIAAGILSENFRDPNNRRVGLVDFDRMTSEQRSQLVRAIVQLQGQPDLRAATLWVHTFIMRHVQHRDVSPPLPADEVMRALGEIGGKVAIDIHEPSRTAGERAPRPRGAPRAVDETVRAPTRADSNRRSAGP